MIMCSAVISEMRAEGVKLDPLNIAAALMKANLSPEEVAQSMIALGVKPSVVETAMGSKYGSAIARAVGAQTMAAIDSTTRRDYAV